ncbi:MAG: hydrogenase accessory protein HypB [Herminiimonas sp.]|nr:hydrogenase accessory protein HypB [Herminiimonas sp.]
MFRAARLMILSKTDLLPHLRFDMPRCIDYARHGNPQIRVILLSAFNGEGLDWAGKETARDKPGMATRRDIAREIQSLRK